METEKIRYIPTPSTIALHVLLMRQWSETRFGVDRKDLLESALNRPRQASAYDEADIFEQAATLCFGLIKNHPWFGGNKRTATFIAVTFLRWNGFVIESPPNEFADFALNIDLGNVGLPEIAVWFAQRSLPIE